MKRNAAVAVVLLSLGALAYLWYTRGGPTNEPEGTPGDGVTAPALPTPDTRDRGGQQPPMDVPTSEEDDPIGDLRLEGQVIDRDDIGVGGATVTISSNPPRTATTEGDGTFFFEQLIAREYYLTATAGDQVGALAIELTADSDPAIIRVREGARLAITIVDGASNRPIRDATVSVRGVRDQTETTGADGVARFSGVPSGFAVTVASADGYARGEALVQIPDTPGGAVEETIALRAGAPVAGRVIDEAGKPIAGARVLARDAGGLFSTANPKTDGAETNADGEFRIAAVAGGTYRFTAHHEDYPKASSDAITLDGATERTGVLIEMKAGVTLAGTVVTADGQPAKWATVRVGPKNWNAFSGGWEGVRQAIADEGGAFEFEAMQRETVLVTASSETASSESAEVDLEARGSVDDVVLTLNVDGVIAGRVVDGEGGPVAEATVSALPDFMSGAATEDWAIRGGSTATTGGGGRFEFRGLREGTYLLRANRSASTGFDWYALTTGTRAQTGDDDVTIVLEPEGGLKGRVQFSDGRTPEVFTVGIGFTAPRPGGDDGRFEIEGLPGGTYDVVFRGPRFADKTVRDVKVEGGDTRDMGTIEVAAGRAVSGRVVGPGGRGVEGATVMTGRQLFSDGSSLGGSFGGLMDEQMGIRRTKSDAGGSYRIAGIAAREGVIAAEHPEVGRSVMVPVPAGDDDLHLDLPLVAFGGIEGTITSAGEPAGGATVMAAQKGSQSPIIVTAESDGSYVVAKLPAGDYLVTAMIQAGFGSMIRQARAVTVAPGAPTALDIDIEVGDVTLVVEVQGKDGADIAMAQVFLAEGSWRFENVKQLNEAFMGGDEGNARATLAAEGKQATFEKLAPGAYSACIIPLSGNLNDPQFAQRLQEFADQLQVHCKALKIKPTPKKQTYIAVVPPMAPLPEPGQ